MVFLVLYVANSETGAENFAFAFFQKGSCFPMFQHKFIVIIFLLKYIIAEFVDMIYDEDLLQYFWVQMVCGIWEQTS